MNTQLTNFRIHAEHWTACEPNLHGTIIAKAFTRQIKYQEFRMIVAVVVVSLWYIYKNVMLILQWHDYEYIPMYRIRWGI